MKNLFLLAPSAISKYGIQLTVSARHSFSTNSSQFISMSPCQKKMILWLKLFPIRIYGLSNRRDCSLNFFLFTQIYTGKTCLSFWTVNNIRNLETRLKTWLKKKLTRNKFLEWHTKRKTNYTTKASSLSSDHSLHFRFSIALCLPTFPIFDFILDVLCSMGHIFKSSV